MSALLVVEVLRAWVLARMKPGPGQCVDWTGSRSGGRKGGYAQARIGNSHVRAGRLVHELFVGPVWDGLDVLHACDRPVCVGAWCLSAGTASQNMRDMVSRGRAHTPRGSAHGRAKLTESQRHAAVRMRASATNAEVAAAFGVNESTIRRLS